MWIKPFLLLLLFACASDPGDPLKNSKKLIKEGHASLYQNGAFSVPQTKIKLIPPGPDAIKFAKELSGVKAKDSFLRYVNEIKDSSVQIYSGTKRSYTLAKDVDKNLSRELAKLSKKIKKESMVIMDAGIAKSKNIMGKSLDVTVESYRAQKDFSKKIVEFTQNVEFEHEKFQGFEKFVVAYVGLPEKLKENGKEIKESADLDRFVKSFNKSNELREKYSKDPVYLIKDSFKNYSEDVHDSFVKAKTTLGESDTYGVSFSLIKSVSWLIEGILWQGIIKPVGKLTAGAIGYTFVNGVAYPIYLITRSGVTTGMIAVEVTKEVSEGVFHITAPTIELAFSGLFYSGEFVLKETSEKSVKGVGLAVGKSLEYIGAPIGSSLMGAGTAVSGVAVGVGTGVLAGSMRATSEVMGISSQMVAKTAGATVLSGGVIVHTLKGTGEVAYEIVKATTVPPGLVLGSGLTLSYGTVSQLAGQTVLAASDAAYLVLSMEGPKWVVYAVQGKLGDEVPSNTIVDLEKLHSEGEEILKVPATEEEIQKLLKTFK